MLYVSIFVELLRSQPRTMFWLLTLAQAGFWWLVPTVFYAAPPGDLAQVLAIGHEFQLGSYAGPPLAFWLADFVFRIAGMPGVYLLSQICVVVTYWAVFELGCAIVTIHHAVLAVGLMIGLAPMTLPSAEFGPSMLAMPLTALAMLHLWHAVGENNSRYWIPIGIELGLLLLTSYAGLIMLAAVAVVTLASGRGRTMFTSIDAWIAVVVLAILLFPHLLWIHVFGGGFVAPVMARLRGVAPITADIAQLQRLLSSLVVTYAGVALLVALSAGWGVRRSAPVPRYVRHSLDAFSRWFVYFLAAAPIIAASALALVFGAPAPLGGTAPHVVLTGVAVVAAAGPTIAIHRQRIVGFAWILLLVLPPLIVAFATLVLPWAPGVVLKVELPANDIGRFMGESFERRTGKPLEIVSGDAALATLVAMAAPTRPSVYDYAAPDRSPWVTGADVPRKGLIVVWPVTATGSLPPPDIKARFPDLVPEVPRAFSYRIQGRLPLLRIGWGMIRPQDAPGQ